jgi:YrbI family 3-deoxy-D-manno-octulosonate 8-phosphate phosphatase
MGKESNSIIAFIPARGGSKSIPYKNIKPIAGRPLIYWVLDAAVQCQSIDAVYVSTDDARIEEVVNAYGSEKVKVFRRNPETATDTASTESAMIEFAEKHDFSHMVLIQATSPLLEAKHLQEGISHYIATNADSLVSAVRQKRFLWEHTEGDIVRPVNYDPVQRPRRQDFNGYLVENGSFYICRRKNLLASGSRLSGRIVCYEMPEESYYELDDPRDFLIIENLLKSKKINVISAHSDILRNIKLFLMDVDGVLTDAGMYYSEAGDELKKFNTRDGKGIELLRKHGIKTGIITSEKTDIVARRANKLQIDYVRQGITDKLSCFRDLIREANVKPSEVVYIGDDVNDLELLREVGFSAATADAVTGIKNIVMYVCKQKGGKGCVREVTEIILESRGLVR